MDRLWSPWRGEHVARAADKSRQPDESGGPDVFVQIATAPENDAENHVLWRGEHVFVVMNRYPYTNGHLLLVPYREVDAYNALAEVERHELADLTARAMDWLRTALAPDGFNVGINQGSAAGAGIPRHLHLHVVPRWTGDTNFMPVVGEAKVIPEALATTFQKLTEAIAAES